MTGNYRRVLSSSFLILAAGIMVILDMAVSEAVPAFARKYQTNCALCHTNVPRLAPFGQQFKANGYQFPSTEDGGETAKIILDGPQGPVTLDKISNMMAVRLRGDVFRPSFRQRTDTMNRLDVRDSITIKMPTIVNFFLAGTARKNISYFAEAEYNTFEARNEDAAIAFERVFLVFSNLGGQNFANLQVGVFDPSGLFAFPTHRQQMNPVFPVAETALFPAEIGRIPQLPLAFSSKMFGLTKGQAYDGEEGHTILPFEPYLYNAPSQKGFSLYGRPLGGVSGFLYQIGVAENDKAVQNGVETKTTRYDPYAMGRYDGMVQSVNYQVSAFYYSAKKAAIATLAPNNNVVHAMNPTDINRWGIGARGQWGDWDIYGTYVRDQIDQPTFAVAPLNTSVWESTGEAVSVEADWRFHKNWMFGMRYDWMAPGGLSKLPMGADPARTKLNVDVTFLAGILKYYPSPNISLYARAHLNARRGKTLPNTAGQNVVIDAFDGTQNPASNLRSMLALGVDMAF